MYMNRAFIPLLLIASAACSPAKEPRAPGRYVDKLEVAGKVRDYILRVPKGYDHTKPTPVVVALHGLTSSATQFDSILRLGEKADAEGFIAVIPNGIPESFRGWNAGFFKMAGDKSDAEFIAKALDQVESEFNVDKKREYVFGHSNGAMMSYYLGSVLGDRLAAVAGVAGTVGIPTSTKLDTIPDPKSPISVLLIHGQQDNMVAFKRGDRAMLQSIGANESAEWWASKFGLPVKVETVRREDGITSVRDFGTNEKGAQVKLLISRDGTHDVFGGYYGSGRESKSGILALDEIWSFFKDHPKP